MAKGKSKARGYAKGGSSYRRISVEVYSGKSKYESNHRSKRRGRR